jgi:hypothetical protein
MGITMDFLRDEQMPLIMTSSLGLISKSHSLRCDARQAEPRFAAFEEFVTSVEHFYLGDFLPAPIVKGSQPTYIESVESDIEGVPVISTIVIQRLAINKEACRYITQEDYDTLDDARKPKPSDVLLTVDGGTSIGKPVLFELEESYAIDSHVAILRPEGLDPRVLVYLLASPLGQVQFRQAESGASGQTAVLEEDIRRFRFPAINGDDLEAVVTQFEHERSELARLEAELHEKERNAWRSFNEAITASAVPRRRPSTASPISVPALSSPPIPAQTPVLTILQPPLPPTNTPRDNM